MTVSPRWIQTKKPEICKKAENSSKFAYCLGFFSDCKGDAFHYVLQLRLTTYAIPAFMSMKIGIPRDHSLTGETELASNGRHCEQSEAISLHRHCVRGRLLRRFAPRNDSRPGANTGFVTTSIPSRCGIDDLNNACRNHLTRQLHLFFKMK